MDILIAFLALNILIIVHELGHFGVAKWSNMKVHEFALFMGPKIFSITKGETTYSLRSLPIGGYVKLEGEDVSSDDERAFNNRPLFMRALVIFAGPFMNVLLAVGIFLILYNVFAYQSNEVGEVWEGSPAYNIGITEGDKVVKYDNKSVFNYTDLLIFMNLNDGKATSIEIERDGQLQTYEIIPRIYDKDRYLVGYIPKALYGKDSNVVMKEDENGKKLSEPTGEQEIENYSKLEHNDRIVKMNNTPISNMDDIMNFLRVNKDKNVKVTLLREEKEKIVDIKPFYRSVERKDYDIGLWFGEVESESFLESINATMINTYATIRLAGYNFYGMISGSFSIKDMAGPVGIVSYVGDLVKESRKISIQEAVKNMLQITAILSIIIGVTNLIPIPPFDGGKLLLIGIEAIRRKPLNQNIEYVIALTGFVILILLSIVVFYNDVLRLIST